MKSFPLNDYGQVDIRKGVPEGFTFLDIDTSIADSAGIPWATPYHGSQRDKYIYRYSRNDYLPTFGPDIHGIVIHNENLPKIAPYLDKKERKRILLAQYDTENGLITQLTNEDIVAIKSNKTITATVKKSLINARLGQGKFREDVIEIEKRCRITGVEDRRFLIASHIKSWRESSNVERLDGYNGLLLSPHIDKLFDAYYISFKNDGSVLISKTAQELINAWKIDIKNVGAFHTQQKKYLKFHREKFRAINL